MCSHTRAFSVIVLYLLAPSYSLCITLATGSGEKADEWVDAGRNCSGPCAGRAGTATLCYLDAKVTLLIAQYPNLRHFFSPHIVLLSTLISITYQE